LLARTLGRQTELPFAGGVLARTQRRRPQVGLSAAERAANLQGAFALRPAPSLAGRRVLLVDDTWTTAATLAKCATDLREGGAAAVFGLTVTRQAESDL